MWDRGTELSHSAYADLCGAERTRTADPLLAKQVLYQLSYRPGEMRETRSKTPAHVLGTLAIV
jgi:hypothetical protein